jgi:hypothetical protein
MSLLGHVNTHVYLDERVIYLLLAPISDLRLVLGLNHISECVDLLDLVRQELVEFPRRLDGRECHGCRASGEGRSKGKN